MGERFDVSVVICTYNRCDSLPGALESILAQQSAGVRYESSSLIITRPTDARSGRVVDRTRPREHALRLRGKQGLSTHAILGSG